MWRPGGFLNDRKFHVMQTRATELSLNAVSVRECTGLSRLAETNNFEVNERTDSELTNPLARLLRPE
jgi:hypothetical protein